MTCVTGVSGSGKSTLVLDTLYRALARKIYNVETHPAPFSGLENAERLRKVILVDQSPIGRTPRSIPATYTGVFGLIRQLFSRVPEARARGYSPARFSFNAKGGRCEHCRGEGLQRIEMYFLPDIYVTCPVCEGSRYNRETLDITYRGYSIASVLEMTVYEAAAFFGNFRAIRHKLDTLIEVGMGYIRLGQPATTLSGGEAQRIKLAAELSRRGQGKALYILDEPTTGLHFEDISKLLHVLRQTGGPAEHDYHNRTSSGRDQIGRLRNRPRPRRRRRRRADCCRRDPGGGRPLEKFPYGALSAGGPGDELSGRAAARVDAQTAGGMA